eukprot:10228981-Alexandrium_andersonii.AAC.1
MFQDGFILPTRHLYVVVDCRLGTGRCTCRSLKFVLSSSYAVHLALLTGVDFTGCDTEISDFSTRIAGRGVRAVRQHHDSAHGARVVRADR